MASGARSRAPRGDSHRGPRTVRGPTLDDARSGTTRSGPLTTPLDRRSRRDRVGAARPKERTMTPLFKRLLGNETDDRELAQEMRNLLQEIRKESGRCEALIERARVSGDRLQQLGEPIDKAGSDVEAVSSRLESLQPQLEAMTRLTAAFQTLEERAESIARHQEVAQTQLSATLEDSQRIRSGFEDLSRQIDVAVDLRDRLESFLEMDKPLRQLRGDADTLRSQVDGTGDHLARLREQHDRLMDAHKL